MKDQRKPLSAGKRAVSYSYGPLTYAFKDLKGSLFVILYIYTLSFKKVDESGIVEIARGI